ncbi:acetyl-coenzyme A synthetase N-terminal domain-containing protein, partial [Methylibium sp. Root1272]
MTDYATFYRRSIEDPAGFWAEQAKLIDWHRPFDTVLPARAARWP